MDSNLVFIINSVIVEYPQTPLLLQGVNSQGNLCNITPTIPIDISIKTRIFEQVHIGQNYLAIETEEYQSLFKELWEFFSGS